MTQLDDFLTLSMFDIKSGVDTFNKGSGRLKAEYPETISFEVCVDEKGFVGMGKEKITITVPWKI